MGSPYGAIADVRMLNFFRDLGETAAIVLGFLFVASVLVQNFWCRYLCPYGALLGLAIPAEPAAHSPLRARLHRLREVRQGLPLRPPGRQAHHDQVSGVHGMSGVRRSLPVRGRSASGPASLDALAQRWTPPCMGNGRGNCSFVLRNCRIRQDRRLLEWRRAGLHLSPARAAGERRESSSGVKITLPP